MATIIPSLDAVKASRQPPTEGEIYLLQYLQDNFDADAEVYFQPCVNGDRPDIVIIKKNVGVIVIEVKDWLLDNFKVDEENKWRLKRDGCLLRSPCAQVFHYKQTFFKIHINGLLEKAVRNKKFYGLVNVFVYFHKATKPGLESFYEPSKSILKTRLAGNYAARAAGAKPHDQYEREDGFIRAKLKQLERDLAMSLTRENLKKIAFSKNLDSGLFNEGIYAEFIRLLSPPFHYANQGKPLVYTKKQEKLSESRPGRMKVRGLAGAGKTTVLAKRAVNAHQRHGGEVLLLTYNLTLRMYIRDKLNEVRGDFSWDAFQIKHYHGFITSVLGNAGVDVPPPPGNEDAESWYERNFYSNEKLFEDLFSAERGEVTKRKGAVRYKTILIDEIQDYKNPWIKILLKYFLEDGGELVLFGDEKQNIYDRPVDDEKKTRLPDGFGRWEMLSQSFRYKSDSHILALASTFQKEFLAQRYEWDADASFQQSLSLVGINAIYKYNDDDCEQLTEFIIGLAKREAIHPNDVSIIASQKSDLQEIDFCIRNGAFHRERTITTFSAKELIEQAKIIRVSEAYGLKPYGEVDAGIAEKFIGGEEALKKFRAKLQMACKLFKTSEEANQIIKDVEKQKKYGFNLNSGVMKLSTTHSFKGFESPTVFLLVGDKDQAEMVYTGLTRAKENIIVFAHEKTPYLPFFQANLEPLARFL